MNSTTLQPNWPIRPVDLSEARAILGEKFISREFWMLVVHGSAVGFLIDVERRYYSGAKNQDFHLITYIEGGEVFGVVAAKKRHMLAYQLVSMLRRYSEVKISEREILRRDLAIVAPGERLITAALQLAYRLFWAKDELAMAE